MNIKQAKEEIKHAIAAYLAKDEYGQYCIPMTRQRPLLLMGAPGIGKTAVMEQVARECGVGLVAYSITHHTRQSAIGLPFISQKQYGGKTYAVTEYTMSEIIAAVYDKMEETGLREWMRSTAYRKRWRLRCCSFCRQRPSVLIRCRKAG